MRQPTPRFYPGSPLELVDAYPLFPDGPGVTHKAASLIRLDKTGRLLLGWNISDTAEQTNAGQVLLSRSDDGGATWSRPQVVFEREGWHVLLMGGLNKISDRHVRMIVGGVKLDFSLGGPEPFTASFAAPMDSHDGGKSWPAPGSDIDLFPCWTEPYGASNPHVLSDGRLMWAVIGTMGRDDQWHAGVSFTDAKGNGYTKPVIIAYAPDRNYADTDVVRLPDGRFLAVIRELTYKDSYYSLSADEGMTWTPIRLTGFKGANIKLVRLKSGAVVCAYRNEDPARRGVACSVTTDGGQTWRETGWLYVAPHAVRHQPSYLCGYPDMVYTGERDLFATMHTYPDADGRIYLHGLKLREVG